MNKGPIRRPGAWGGRRKFSGPASMRVSASGHAALSVRAMDALGWPDRVLIAARDGAIIMRAGTDDDHRAYRLAWAVYEPSGAKTNARLCARTAFKIAGLLPASGSARFLALECDSDDGRRALFIRQDQQIAVELRMRRPRNTDAVSA